jgi:DNA-directed RNA polymerase specialized sigma24 family protein
MCGPDSVSQWILGLQQGDSLAAQRLWERYFHRLVFLAHRKLAGARPPAADEEDIALSAFAEFCRAAQAGRFTFLKDREDLWRLLIRITAEKAVDQLRRDGRLKRGGGHGRNDVVLTELVGDTPSPEFSAMVAEHCRILLESLDEPLRQVALARLEGYTNHEIACQLDCSVSSVERKLRLIRKTWQRKDQP